MLMQPLCHTIMSLFIFYVQDGQALFNTLTSKSAEAAASSEASDISSYSQYDDIETETDIASPIASKMLLVYNKADLNSTTTQTTAARPAILNSISNNNTIDAYHISCTTGAGLEILENAIANAVHSLLNLDATTNDTGAASSVGSTMITRERHRRHVKVCVYHLERFLSGRLPMDAAAEEIRLVSFYITIYLLFLHLRVVFVRGFQRYYCSELLNFVV